ncbi:LysR family transcriptional regulator [Algirhabdus cladophorae]|uniref:LysR family transcriptional regulator n=1 Tax=Algirhabdus cladophorae TaxID=3377108 RepID=UPI003B845214
MRIFVAVARLESLSSAAKALKVDPATVGRRIARLETDLGGALFAKSPQGYALTDLGQRVQTHAEQAEGAMALAREEAQGSEGRLTGQIRIGAPDGSANFLLPQVCAEISRENPELEIQILALPRVVNLSKREADMAVTVSPPVAGRMSVQKIADYRLHVAASVEYLNSAPPIRNVADLRDHPIVGYIPDMIFDKELDYLNEMGVERVALASNSVSVQLNMLRQGAGVGVAHDFAMPLVGGLQKVLADEVSLTRSFYLVRHASDARVERLSRFAQRLVTGLRAEVAKLEALA